MSYTIVYDRVGLKLDDGSIMLMWCNGSSNCTMFDYTTRREIYEREWYNFDKENPVKKPYEWRKYLADICDKYFGDNEKTFLYTSHESDAIHVIDFYNGLWNSVKRAQPIEDFVKKGNILYIVYNDKDRADWNVTKKEIVIRNIYNSDGLRKYVKLCTENHYSFNISLKNFKRIKK